MALKKYNPNVPEDLKFLTESGAIWLTGYAQKGIDAIRAGTIKLADCKAMPENIKAIVTRPHG